MILDVSEGDLCSVLDQDGSVAASCLLRVKPIGSRTVLSHLVNLNCER